MTLTGLGFATSSFSAGSSTSSTVGGGEALFPLRSPMSPGIWRSLTLLSPSFLFCPLLTSSSKTDGRSAATRGDPVVGGEGGGEGFNAPSATIGEGTGDRSREAGPGLTWDASMDAGASNGSAAPLCSSAPAASSSITGGFEPRGISCMATTASSEATSSS